MKNIEKLARVFFAKNEYEAAQEIAINEKINELVDAVNHSQKEFDLFKDMVLNTLKSKEPEEPELKNCIFCPSKFSDPHVEEYEAFHGVVFAVTCAFCQSCGPHKDYPFQAIDAWNKRRGGE